MIACVNTSLMHVCKREFLEDKCSVSTKSVVRASGTHLQLITPTSLLIKSSLEVEAEKLIKLLSPFIIVG